MVAMLALESGRTIFAKIVTSFAPSSLADSSRLSGIVEKKLRIMITLYALMSPGRIRDQRLSIRCMFLISRYPGFIPPENSMVNRIRKFSVFWNGRFALESGYAVVAVNRDPNTVPSTVTPIVVAYPVQMDGS